MSHHVVLRILVECLLVRYWSVTWCVTGALPGALYSVQVDLEHQTLTLVALEVSKNSFGEPNGLCKCTLCLFFCDTAQAPLSINAPAEHTLHMPAGHHAAGSHGQRRHGVSVVRY